MEIKKWVKDHRKELAIAVAGVTIGGVLGIRIANKSSRYSKNVVNELSPVLKDSNKVTMAYKITDETITLSRAPELLGQMLECNCVKNLLDKEITGIAVFHKE